MTDTREWRVQKLPEAIPADNELGWDLPKDKRPIPPFKEGDLVISGRRPQFFCYVLDNGSHPNLTWGEFKDMVSVRYPLVDASLAVPIWGPNWDLEFGGWCYGNGILFNCSEYISYANFSGAQLLDDGWPYWIYVDSKENLNVDPVI